MNLNRLQPRYILAFSVLFALMVSIACFSAGTSLPKITVSPTDVQLSPKDSQPAGVTQTGSEFSLPDPLAGLSALNSYHLNYSSTIDGVVNGQEYAFDLSIEGWQNGADQAELVQQTSTGYEPVYLDMVLLAGKKYIQQEAGATCRTSEGGDTLISSQTIKIPPIYNAKYVGQESINNIPANHYQFDENSVKWQAGQNGKAQGDVWIAETGDLLLKYQLSIKLPSGDFQGTRTWSYEFADINGGTEIVLPEGCLPLITDISFMDGATEVIELPGFQKYIVSVTLDQVISFYMDQLLSAGWTLLAEDQPEAGNAKLTFTIPHADGGSRFVVIQMNEANGQTGVVVQAANTKKAILMDATPGPGTVTPNENPTGTPETIDQSETPEATMSIPADFPQYPGATTLVQTEQILVLQTNDSLDTVASFYNQGLENTGFTLENDMTVNGIITQTWTRDQLRIILVIMQQGDMTQITVSAEAN